MFNFIDKYFTLKENSIEISPIDNYFKNIVNVDTRKSLIHFFRVESCLLGMSETSFIYRYESSGVGYRVIEMGARWFTDNHKWDKGDNKIMRIFMDYVDSSKDIYSLNISFVSRVSENVWKRYYGKS